jgi:MHS family alpha-ketoglutarate permease-like MFS transporter
MQKKHSEKQIAINIFKGSLGNMIEWFDWSVYASFAIYFSAVFFPSDSNTAKLLGTAAIFAIGFLSRPFGGFIIGRYADRHGRRSALTLSILIMSTGSFLISIMPTYDSIGIWAPIILLLARVFQGISVGGEYGTSATYTVEMSSPKRRGFYSSFQYVTTISGQLFALLILIIIQNVLSAQQISDWGWRIPFAIGACGALIVLWLRLSMDESDKFVTTNKGQKAKEAGTIRLLLKYPKQVLTIVGMTIGATVAYYTYTTYLQKFMINTVGLPKESVSIISFSALIIFMILQPIFGSISDRVGRQPLLLCFGIFGTLFTVPILTMLSHTDSFWLAFGLMTVCLMILACFTSVGPVVAAEIFPTEVRAIGINLPYGLTVGIFGGTVEYIALWLHQANIESLFFYYVTGVIFISLIVYWRMGESSKNKYI